MPAPHHVIGTLGDSDTDETMSIGQISGDGVVGVGDVDEFSVHRDEAISVGGEGAASEVEAVPTPVADGNPLDGRHSCAAHASPS